MAFEDSASRLWRRLSVPERQKAAAAFFREPPAELVGSALGALVKARRLRPQAARALPADEQARILATLLDPGEALASSLLVSLHLDDRRVMLAAFLDALGLAHEDGVLKEEGEPPPLAEGAAQKAVRALAASFSRPDVELYLNTLWLQDPRRWEALRKAPEWL